MSQIYQEWPRLFEQPGKSSGLQAKCLIIQEETSAPNSFQTSGIRANPGVSPWARWLIGRPTNVGRENGHRVTSRRRHYAEAGAHCQLQQPLFRAGRRPAQGRRA